jgi:hypothetical protein
MHKVIIRDNFLPDSTFEMLRNKYVKTSESEEIQRDIFGYDPTPQISDYLSKFRRVREHKKLGKFIHTAATPPEFHHPIHDEAEFKIMSAIVYVGPGNSHGTKFYMREGATFEYPEGDFYTEYDHEVEWKPNRLVIFCGESGVTWHDYKSDEKMRFTYNYFLVDPTKIKNEVYKNSILRM